MLEFEDVSDPEHGAVFDLTALVSELMNRGDRFSSNIGVDVRATRNYGPDRESKPFDMEVGFDGYNGGEFVHGASHIADVVNITLPDGERVLAFKRTAKRLAKKAEEATRCAQTAKLEQVANVRAQHPIARVTETPMLPDVAAALDETSTPQPAAV